MITKIDTLTATIMMAAHRLCKRVIKYDSPKHRIVDVLIVQECKDLLAIIEKRDIMVRESVTNPQLFTLPGCIDNDQPIRQLVHEDVGTMPLTAIEREDMNKEFLLPGQGAMGSQEDKIDDDHSHYQKQGF